MAKPGLMDRASQLVRHVVPGVVRPLHSLWHQVVGSLFVAFAAVALLSLFRTVRDFQGDAESFFRIVLTGIFAFIMAAYGISSFLKARKISRS